MNQFLSFMSVLKSLQTAGISHNRPPPKKQKQQKKQKQNKTKQKKTSPDINLRLKPYI